MPRHDSGHRARSAGAGNLFGSRRPAPALLLAAVFSPTIAAAQTITTNPVAPVPTMGPWILPILGVLLMMTAWWLLRTRDARRATVTMGVLVAMGLAVWQGPALLGRIAATFTDPAGETLAIPVVQITNDDGIAGFEPADFTNAAGVDLLIQEIVVPDFAACFPGGLGTTSLLPPASSDPSPHPACAEDEMLATDATCRVDVETICRAAAEAGAPTLASLDPVTGPATGGTNVTLTGTNLTGATDVSFGGTAATNVTVVSATTVTADAPAHAAGAVDVVVTTPGGTSTLAGAFTYEAATPTLTAIDPISGSTTGGTTVTLTGADLTAATSVTFDGTAATNVTVVNATTVTADTPAHVAGAVDVAVTAPGGTATLAGGFTYVEFPTFTAINPTSGTASGGTGFTLTGTGLTGATAITFDGIPATNINVVNSTTVTGVTPAHAVGVVDVVVDTPAGGATHAGGYTYVATAVGQPSGGGVIAVLNGGLSNLIAATADNSTAIQWGGLGTVIGAGAQSDTDGASNTAAIVAALGNNGGTPYAAQLCNDYEVDSQGNMPCQAGNACYDDWFLPAGNNLTASGQLNGLFTNRAAIGGFAGDFYWSSTELSGGPAFAAWLQEFSGGAQIVLDKISSLRVRCVRAFVP